MERVPLRKPIQFALFAYIGGSVVNLTVAVSREVPEHGCSKESNTWHLIDTCGDSEGAVKAAGNWSTWIVAGELAKSFPYPAAVLPG